MVVVYAYRGTKGFVPCSMTYKKQVRTFIDKGQIRKAYEMYRQVHKIIWKGMRDGRYVHMLKEDYIISPEEHNELSQFNRNTPRDEAIGMLDRQCPALTRKQWEPRRFLGPQSIRLEAAYRWIENKMKAARSDMQEQGLDMKQLAGPSLYPPNPFPISWQGDRRQMEIRPCDDSQQCRDFGGECEQNVCVIPRSQRVCPTYPVDVLVDGIEYNNIAGGRTRPQTKYSTYSNALYKSCGPPPDKMHFGWIPPRLRIVLDINFNVLEIEPNEWERRVDSQEGQPRIYYDPDTDAMFFIERNLDQEIMHKYLRVYKMNAAYTPDLELNELETIDGQPVESDEMDEIQGNAEAPDDADEPDEVLDNLNALLVEGQDLLQGPANIGNPEAPEDANEDANDAARIVRAIEPRQVAQVAIDIPEGQVINNNQANNANDAEQAPMQLLRRFGIAEPIGGARRSPRNLNQRRGRRARERNPYGGIRRSQRLSRRRSRSEPYR